VKEVVAAVAVVAEEMVVSVDSVDAERAAVDTVVAVMDSDHAVDEEADSVATAVSEETADSAAMVVSVVDVVVDSVEMVDSVEIEMVVSVVAVAAVSVETMVSVEMVDSVDEDVDGIECNSCDTCCILSDFSIEHHCVTEEADDTLRVDINMIPFDNERIYRGNAIQYSSQYNTLSPQQTTGLF